MNLKCAIVDDEPLALGLLESYVNKTPFLELVGKYSSAVQAIKELPEKHIDLLFLDIGVGGELLLVAHAVSFRGGGVAGVRQFADCELLRSVRR